MTATTDLSDAGVGEGLTAARGARGGLVPLESGSVAMERGPAVDAGQGEPAPRVWRAIDFDRIYEAHFDFVWRSLHLLGIPPESIEDATQDTFSVVSRQLAQFEERSALRTWIFGILQRVAANYRRTRRRKLSQLTPFAESVGNEPAPDAHAEAAEAVQAVERFCATLEPERRTFFVLAVLEETPAAEVSMVFGIPLGTVYSRVHALREQLRLALAERENERG